MKKSTLVLILALSSLVLFFQCNKENDIKVETGTFTDSRDGQTYKWVKIGDQVWMAENLKYLPSVVGPGTGSETVPYYYVYGNVGTDLDEAKIAVYFQMYGVLYNWSAAMNEAASSRATPSGVQGVCPIGWHVPSDSEWTQLVSFVGDNAGRQLKARRGWYNNGNGTDDYGFSALPGGSIYLYERFTHVGGYGSWWTSTENSSSTAFFRGLGSSYRRRVYHSSSTKGTGFSVRCVRDAE